MKSLVLHIGIPKTGSSALQVCWAQNRNALLAQSLDYFELGDFTLGLHGKISSGNGAHLARSFLQPQAEAYLPTRDQQLAQLDRRIRESECDTGVLSSELFVFADDARLAEFASWLAERGISLKFFYFIRDQVQFLTSTYIQQVKRHACTESAEQYILRTYDKIAHIKYSRLFERLRQLVPAENIICRNYQETRLSEHGIFDIFLGSFGLDPEGLKVTDPSVNLSLDMTEIKIMLALNKLKPRMVFSDMIVENAARRRREDVDLASELLAAKTVEKIESYFAEDNAAFARSYFGSDTLFEPTDRSVTGQPGANGETGLDQVIEVFGGLLVRFDERLATMEQKIKHHVTASTTKP
jgi:hypothetical protein